MKIMWVNQCKAKSYPSPLLLSCLQFAFFFFKRALSTIWSFRSHRTQVNPAWQRELRTARVRERNSSLLPRGGGEESRALRLIPLQPLHPCSWTAMRGCFTGIAWGQMQNAWEGNLPKWITELLLLVSSFSAGAAIYKQGEPSGQGAEGTGKLSTPFSFPESWWLNRIIQLPGESSLEVFAFVHFKSPNGVISLNILIEVIAVKILEPIK